MSSRSRVLVEIALAMHEMKESIPGDLECESLQDEINTADDTESDGESIHSDHQTDSEQSEDEDGIQNDDPENILIGKDKTTVWYQNSLKKNASILNHNSVIHLPGVKGEAIIAKTPIACWSMFFSDSLIDRIAHYTNLYLNKLIPNNSTTRDIRETDVTELKALFGLLYMAGLMRAQHVNVKELWDKDGTAPECFKVTMSKKRFLLLLRTLRFDNFEDRTVRKARDKLASIREVLDEFVIKCKNNYQVGEYSTIDEILEPFRGRCKFRKHIPSKPEKCGIKIFALVDACTFYTNNIEVDCGHQPEGLYNVTNNPTEVVKRLANHIFGTGRNITMDSYFTSMSLAKELLAKKTTLVGILRKKKSEIPPSFLLTKNKPVFFSNFGFTKTETLVSYKPKTNKIVLALSTLHNDNNIDESTGDLAKPEIITFYDLTKRGVDAMNEMKALYSVSRFSCRWPLTLFFSFLNIGGINSCIIYKANTEDTIERRLFLKTLALSLMKENLIRRSSIPNIPILDRLTMKRIVELQEEEIPSKKIKLGFCGFCARRKNSKTKKECYICKIPICPSHTVHACPTCYGKEV